MRAITAANGCIRAEPHGRAITGSRVHSSRSTTDGIRVIPRNRISWSVQPATRFGHFHDCCRRQPIMFCQLSLRVGSDPGRQECDVDFVGHTPSLASSFSGRVLTFGRIPFLLTFLRPTSGCCQEGKSALTLLCRILLLPARQDPNPFKSTLVWHLIASGATDCYPLLQTLSPPYYSWHRGRMEEERSPTSPHTSSDKKR